MKIRLKWKRKKSLKKLKQKYQKADSKKKKEKIMDKFSKIAPQLDFEEYVNK